MSRRIVLIAALAFTLAASVGVAYRDVQARQFQIAITSTCAAIPSFLNAYDYTVRTWPSDTVELAEEVQQNLAYFTAAVKTDRQWCDTVGATAPELAHGTMLWHFGHASALLAQYQAAARAAGVPAAPTPVASTPTPVATTAPAATTGKRFLRWTPDDGLAGVATTATVVGADQTLRLDAAALEPGRDTTGGDYLTGSVTWEASTAGLHFDEAVPSWEAVTPLGTWVQAELSARIAGQWTHYYNLGVWAADSGTVQRHSVKGQQDFAGTVYTDTLAIAQPADGLRYRLTLFTTSPASTPAVRSLSVAVMDSAAAPPVVGSSGAAWGKALAVPQRSARVHVEGTGEWGSPTSLSMVMAYWAAQPGGRPEWDQPLPLMAASTYDKTYEGHGNWPFNTGYAAHLGLRSAVTRLDGLAEVEEWVQAGVPVVVSIALKAGALSGAPLDASDGSLIVVRGFTVAGNVLANDPAAENNDGVLRVYDRRQFERAVAGLQPRRSLSGSP